MAKLLLNLRHVLDDEADDVRAMLEANDIAWYETPPSMFGISAGGIFIRDDARIGEAKRLMAEYQVGRRARARAEREAALRDGTAETFWTVFRADPPRVLAKLAAILLLIALAALPAFLLRA